MSEITSFEKIVGSFHSGQSTEIYFKEVISLFIPESDLFENYNNQLKKAFTSAFAAGGASELEANQRWEGISTIIRDGLAEQISLKSIEERLLNFYRIFLNPSRTEINQNARADRCFATVKPFLFGKTIVDYGCGKGLLGAKIQAEFNNTVLLVDSIDFNKSSLSLYKSDQEGRTELPDLVADTSIAYLTLHHMDNPLSGLKELARITKSRIILMEGWVEDSSCRYINQAIDWFFNRILLGVDMNVPLNFLTFKQWSVLFLHIGFKVIKAEYVGADEKLAPEHHVLLIAERI